MTTTIAPAHACYRRIPNAPAPFVLIENPDGSVEARWIMAGRASTELRSMHEDRSILSGLAVRLEAYFDGERVDFNEVPTPISNSVFTERCWAACRAIPPGQTISYAELAARAGSPGAARAAGQAMRRNPLPVIVPCHRVVSSSGSLHGYAGHTDDRSRSLAIKRSLLELERGM
jgi:methylated-DNA-[protein]-cysteine S-methyltransferase